MLPDFRGTLNNSSSAGLLRPFLDYGQKAMDWTKKPITQE